LQKIVQIKVSLKNIELRVRLGGGLSAGCSSAEAGCTHALAEIYKYPWRSPPVGNRPFQRKHFVLGCTALPGCTAPLLRRVRLSWLSWRWCRTEGSCITLRSCSTVANATLALARVQHDLHSYQAAQPSTAEVRSPPPSDPMLRYAQHCGVARSAQHATRQYEHAHQCAAEF
jgi:hypothetical protein